jgi:hypothetical protein
VDPKTSTTDQGRLPRLDPAAYRGLACVHWPMTLEARATGWLDTAHHAAVREEGQRIALRLADDLLAALPSAPATLADYLRTATSPPGRATLAAIYFHAIALVNAGWPRA